jgi:sulfate permease, SulP family
MIFRPKILDTLKGYDLRHFRKDLLAGLIVGVVALPLAIAFAVASGVSPEKGLYTAIVAGFLISSLGGSRVQIGGPTGAFIVIVYGIVQDFGINGLIIATFMAGIMLVAMGIARLGTVIRFIPYPLIAGFTSGIAVIIFTSQIKDFFGLNTGTLNSDFVGKWHQYLAQSGTINGYAASIALATVMITFFWPRVNRQIPGSLVAIIVTTIAVSVFHLPVETIGNRFGKLPSSLSYPAFPDLSFATMRELFQPAFTIALLGGIESLLSAVVADGMTGGRHRSNTELIAQGIANIGSSFFGGIPATGAIARTATNIKNGGSTPVAGITHAAVLLLILLFAGKWAAMVPMPSLAGILIVVAYNMSEWKVFRSQLKGPRGDAAVLLTTFCLTVFVDLTVAIEIGLLLAVFLFMRNMIRFSGVQPFNMDNDDGATNQDEIYAENIPPGIMVFEITGPLFFGAVHKFKEAVKLVDHSPAVLIIRMKKVPIIDATGIQTLREIYTEANKKGTALVLSEVHSEQVWQALKKSRLLFAIGKANVKDSFEKALEKSKTILSHCKK